MLGVLDRAAKRAAQPCCCAALLSTARQHTPNSTPQQQHNPARSAHNTKRTTHNTNRTTLTPVAQLAGLTATTLLPAIVAALTWHLCRRAATPTPPATRTITHDPAAAELVARLRAHLNLDPQDRQP